MSSLLAIARVAILGVLGLGLALPAGAADTVRVGRSPGFLFAYTPLDVGIAKGFFAKRGLTINRIDFEGAAKMDQGIATGAADIVLGSPMEMAFAVKGLPALGIAVIAEPMLEFGILVPYNSPVHSFADLKGKVIGVATVGSITQWVALELARVEGWGLNGIKITAIGATPGGAAAALRDHLVDATVSNATLGYRLERAKRGRIVGTAADFVKHFMAHEMYATTEMVRDRPQDIRRFLAGWLEAVAYMRTHKSDAIRIARTATGLDEADEAAEYGRLMRGISADGRFDPKAVERIGDSFVELHLLPKKPDMAKLYTERFLPAR